MKDRDRNRFALRDKWLASEQRNRELTGRLEAAERLVEKWRNVETTNRTSQIVYGWAAEELEQAIAPAAPVKPVAGEEK